MGKIFSLNKIQSLAKAHNNQDKTIGLVVGSFDICHLGHFNLFKLAKNHVDVLFVGLDHDETIKITKGTDRPINNWLNRAEFLEHVESIDGIFLIEDVSLHGSDKSKEIYKNLLKSINPTHVFTHKTCDRHWKEKQNTAKKMQIELVLDSSERVTNSGEILDRLSL